MSSELKTLRVELTAGIGAFQTAFKNAGAAVGVLGKELTGMGSKLDGAFKSLTSGGGIGGALKALGPVGVAAAAGVGAIATAGLAAGKVIGDLAKRGSQLSDLAAKTQIGVESLQRMEYAGSLVGVSLDAIAAASLKVDRALVDSPEKFQRLGLSVQQLLGMNPEQRFEAIAAALRALPDGPQRTAAAFDLLGKSAGEVLPYLTSNLKDLHEEASRLGLVLDEETIKAADALDDSLTRLGLSTDAFKTQLAAIALGSADGAKGIDDLASGVGSLAKYIGENRAAFELLLKVLSKAAGLTGVFQLVQAGGLAVDRGPAVTTPIWKPGAVAPPELRIPKGPTAAEEAADRKRGAAAAKALAVATAELARKTAEAAKAFEALGNAITDASAAADRAEWDKWEGDLDRLGDVLTEASAATEELGQAADDADLDRLGDEVTRLSKETEDAAEHTVDWGAALQSVALLADLLGDNLGGVLQVVGNIGEAFDEIDKNEKLTKAEKDAAKLSAALIAVSEVGKIIATSTNPALEKLGSALQGAGAAAGAAASSGAHPLVIALAGVAGGILGFIGASQRLRDEMAKLTSDFIKSQGGLDALKAKAKEAGVSLDEMLKAKTAKELIKAIDDIKAHLDLWDESQQKLTAAMDKYGITVEQLGPKFRQQKLDEQAMALLEEWSLLNAAGVDHLVLLEKMGPALLDYVNTARLAGVAIPKSMKPIIDELYNQGKLLDENGDAYTPLEYASLHYAETTTEAIDRMIEAIDRLVKALLGIPTDISTDYHFQPVPEGTPYPDRGPAVPRGGYARGTPGVVDFGRETWVPLHGREMVIPENLLPRFSAGGIGDFGRTAAALLSGRGPGISQHGPGAALGGDTFIISPTLNNNPLQTAETTREMNTHIVKLMERRVARKLSDAVAAGKA